MTSSAAARPAAGADRQRPLGPGADNQVIGALLMLLGAAWLVQRSGVVELSWETIMSALLVVLGVGLVATARRPGGSGTVIVGLLLAVALTATSSLDVAILRSGVGNRVVEARDVDGASRVTSLFVGELVVNLSELDLAQASSEASGVGRTTRLTYRLGVGDLQLVLPPSADVAVQVEATVRMGAVDLAALGTPEEGGSNLELRHTDPAFDAESTKLPKLVVDLDVGLGKVTVTRASALPAESDLSPPTTVPDEGPASDADEPARPDSAPPAEPSTTEPSPAQPVTEPDAEPGRTPAPAPAG